MSTNLTALKPEYVADRLARRQAVLVDIREPDEFARLHIMGALSRPLSTLGPAGLKMEPGHDVVFTCRSGMRTAANCEGLRAAVEGDAFILDGGLDGWAAAGLPLEANSKAPIELVRQVHIAAGSLVLIGVCLGFTLSPVFFGLSAFVGAGLALAGVTGFCGMARLLALMPWNRAAPANLGIGNNRL